MPSPAAPPITLCVLTYGNHLSLVQRCLESILTQTTRHRFHLVVGANAPGNATLLYLQNLRRQGRLHRLLVSRRNLNKCPMMRRMFQDIDSRLIAWFDDDSHFTAPDALDYYVDTARHSPPRTVMWGQLMMCPNTISFTNATDIHQFIRTATWYRGLPPPSWMPGGKGEFDYNNRGTGDGRWLFITGGFWIIRSRAIRRLNWPDPRLVKLGDDVLLGEAIRQQGWEVQNTDGTKVAINANRRRGQDGPLLEADSPPATRSRTF